MRIGFAISVYDKFEELGVLIDIIRKNFKKKYIITVCSNYQEADKYLKKMDMDDYIIGEDIKFRGKEKLWWKMKTEEELYIKNIKQTANITCRIYNSIADSVKLAAKKGADYIVHLHSDSWPMKEEEIIKLVKQMKKEGKVFAGRGIGFNITRPDAPFGHLDDMFMIFEKKFALKVFNKHPMNYLPHRIRIHGIMGTLAVCEAGLDRFLFYDDNRNFEYWDGKKKTYIFGNARARPSTIDKRGMLHVNTGDFPDNYGKAIQVFYLEKFNNTRGDNIKKFIKTHRMAPFDIVIKLREIEKKLDMMLRLRLFKVEEFGRVFNNKENALENFNISMLPRNIFKRIIEFINRMSKNKIIVVYDKKRTNIWPEHIKDFYRRTFEEGDYPNKKKIWWIKK